VTHGSARNQRAQSATVHHVVSLCRMLCFVLQVHGSISLDAAQDHTWTAPSVVLGQPCSAGGSLLTAQLRTETPSDVDSLRTDLIVPKLSVSATEEQAAVMQTGGKENQVLARDQCFEHGSSTDLNSCNAIATVHRKKGRA
jgi:hypothetical protein